MNECSGEGLALPVQVLRITCDEKEMETNVTCQNCEHFTVVIWGVGFRNPSRLFASIMPLNALLAHHPHTSDYHSEI